MIKVGSYNIASKIKNARMEKDVTQEVLAKQLGVSRQRYIRIEKGQTDISFKLLSRVARILNVDLKALTEETTKSKNLTVLYREESSDKDEIEGVETIELILKTLFAHEKLYHETHEEDNQDGLY